MKHTFKSLKTAYLQFVDLRLDVKRRARAYFVGKGFSVREDQIEEFLLDWRFRTVFRVLVEASLDESYGRKNWKMIKGSGNRLFIISLSSFPLE
jgi:hypothetical protein